MTLFKLIISQWTVFTLTAQLIFCASIYSNDETTTELPSRRNEIFCNNQEQEKFITDEGRNSSMLLDLDPGSTQNSCNRFFITSEHNGFIVRFIKVKSIIPEEHNIESNRSASDNSTEYFCPISIISMDGDDPPWRFDPCNLKSEEISEPVKILQGRLKILWLHGSEHANYKISITVVSKGDLCKQRNKYPCLKFGNEPLLCISQDLTCDGFVHCPYGDGMLSDENDNICIRYPRNDKEINNNLQKSSIWQHLTLGIFQNIFGPVESTSAISSMNPLPAEQNGFSNDARRKEISNNFYNDLRNKETDQMNYHHVFHKIKSQEPNEIRFIKTPRRSNRNNSLSRYGSWGYMMLGMLLCSVLLLMCGIWECIRRVQKNDILEQFNNNTEVNDTELHERNGDDTCPQYELPPSYSSLFPIAKEFNSGESSIFFTPSSAEIVEATAPIESLSIEAENLSEPNRHVSIVDGNASENTSNNCTDS